MCLDNYDRFGVRSSEASVCFDTATKFREESQPVASLSGVSLLLSMRWMFTQ